VTLDGKKLYFASDRQGPAGNFDIYEIPLPSSEKPIPVSYLKGYVYDSLTQERLNYAAIYISNAKTGDTIYQFQSNRGDGSFLITLHLDNTYAIHTWRMEYKAVDDTVVFDRQYLQQPLVRNIPMLPSNYVRPVNDSMIAMLHFDVMSVALSDSDKAALGNALAPWMAEKNFMIYVNAYTDNTGTPMINEELSHKRAALVANAIVSLGVDENMVQAKGLGEAHMITGNETEEGRKRNRRVEIIIRR
jgi:outer membrane protein OmpA-like peptidoglycan-associated protein